MIAANLSLLQSRLPHNHSVTLIAVSKQQSVEKISQALTAGQRVFGENRVREAKEKWPTLKAQFPDIELHLIGPLQTNKIRDALAIFDVIETIDRHSLAEELAKAMPKYGKTPDLYIQVNTGREPQKAGILPEKADDFILFCRETLHLPIKGLMCIPPAQEDPAPHFTLLKTLANSHQLPMCSMGMSDDFEQAIQLGATHIRLGRAIFGER